MCIENLEGKKKTIEKKKKTEEIFKTMIENAPN